MAVVMKDIAERLGVSRTAVSYALSGTGRLPSETRERIKKAAVEMGYRPNMAASSMQTGKTGTVGVILNFGEDPFFSRVLRGIHDTLATNDYMSLLLVPCEEEPLLDQIYRLIDRRVDGIILRPPSNLDAEVWRAEVEKFGIPLVTVDAPLPKVDHVDFVGNNDAEGGALAARHLLGLGHRRFALVSGSWFYTGEERRKGFERELKMVEGTSCVTVSLDDSEEAVEKLMKLLQDSQRPTALFAVADRLTVPVYRVAHELGFQIGPDLSVLGYADSIVASLMTPPLSSIAQTPEAMGAQAALFLLDRISAKGEDDTPPRRLDMNPSLVLRESTGTPSS